MRINPPTLRRTNYAASENRGEPPPTLGTLPLVLTFLATLIYAYVAKAPTALIVFIAPTSVGLLLGFLFGIPRSLATPAKEGDVSTGNGARLAVNTNLEQVSDWLTKIIVGLGLTQLGNASGALKRLSDYCAPLCSPSTGVIPIASTAAAQIIVASLIAGFLSSYIQMRLVISAMFRHADEESTRVVQAINAESQVDLDQKLRATSSASASNNPMPEGDAMKELDRIAGQYLSIQIQDWMERTRRKDEMANTLGLFVIQNPAIQKSALAQSNNEGVLIALYSAIFIRPESGDFAYIESSIGKVSRLHVKYRALMAVQKLFTGGLMTATEVAQIPKVVAMVRSGADPSLIRLADSTMRLVGHQGASE